MRSDEVKTVSVALKPLRDASQEILSPTFSLARAMCIKVFF